MKSRIQELLPLNRFVHSEGVVDMASQLAKKMSCSTTSLRVAAILHDCAKNMSIDQQIEYARQNNISLNHNDMHARGVIHARIGSYIAHKDFGITDNEVLKAIYCHTTGCGDMGLFQKIIFAADYLEPNRDFKNVDKLRQLIFADFEAGITKIIISKSKFVFKKRNFLHPDMIDFYNSQVR